MCRSSEVKARKGFTLVELAVVIVIIGVLAAFGVPQFLKSVERSKAAEAFNYLSAVRAAQERYIAREGIYADNISLLDITQSSPKYFHLRHRPTAITADAGMPSGKPTWSMHTDARSTTSSYGAIHVHVHPGRVRRQRRQQQHLPGHQPDGHLATDGCGSAVSKVGGRWAARFFGPAEAETQLCSRYNVVLEHRVACDSSAIGVPQASERAAARGPLRLRRPDRQAIGATRSTALLAQS